MSSGSKFASRVWPNPVLGCEKRSATVRPLPRAASLRNHRKLEPGNFFARDGVQWADFFSSGAIRRNCRQLFFAPFNFSALFESFQLFCILRRPKACTALRVICYRRSVENNDRPDANDTFVFFFIIISRFPWPSTLLLNSLSFSLE